MPYSKRIPVQNQNWLLAVHAGIIPMKAIWNSLGCIRDLFDDWVVQIPRTSQFFFIFPPLLDLAGIAEKKRENFWR